MIIMPPPGVFSNLYLCVVGFTAFVDSEFAPVSYIPHELVEYFHVSEG